MQTTPKSPYGYTDLFDWLGNRKVHIKREVTFTTSSADATPEDPSPVAQAAKGTPYERQHSTITKATD